MIYINSMCYHEYVTFSTIVGYICINSFIGVLLKSFYLILYIESYVHSRIEAYSNENFNNSHASLDIAMSSESLELVLLQEE